MTEQREKKRKNIPFKSEQSEGTGILVVQCNALTNDYCQRNKEQKTFQILGPNLIYKLYETPKKDRKVFTFNLKYFTCIYIILHLAH